MTTDLGRRNQATARAYKREQAMRRRGSAGSAQFQTVPRRQRRSSTDRWGRELGRVAADGRAYSPCPNCERRSMLVVEALSRGNKHWKCERCGYEDTDERPLV